MFTGLIEEMGKVIRIASIPGGKRITITAKKVLEDLKIDHSIAVSGICLTVINYNKRTFTAEAVGETLEKSTLSKTKQSSLVNLERALKMSDRLGGHFLQGHVSGTGRVKKLTKRGLNWFLELELPQNLIRYTIKEGSIGVDGVSLTIADIKDRIIGISIIPHTYKNTTISQYRAGQEVNIESDLMAKYMEKFNQTVNRTEKRMVMSRQWLQDLGYKTG